MKDKIIINEMQGNCITIADKEILNIKSKIKNMKQNDITYILYKLINIIKKFNRYIQNDHKRITDIEKNDHNKISLNKILYASKFISKYKT